MTADAIGKAFSRVSWSVPLRRDSSPRESSPEDAAVARENASAKWAAACMGFGIKRDRLMTR